MMIKKILCQIKQIRSKEGLFSLFQRLEQIGKALFAPVEIKSRFINMLIAIPRIVFGILLISDIWRKKIGMPLNETSGYALQLMEFPGWPGWIDKNMILWIDLFEKVGQGSIFLLGFNTRLASFAMLWSIAESWLNDLFTKSLTIPLCILFISVCLYSLVLGSGKIGIDYRISRRIQSKKKTKNN